MKIALINPYPYYASGIEGNIYPPLGLLYIASTIKKHNLGKTIVIDANAMRMANEKIITKLIQYKPDIIGISSNIVTHKSAIELAKLIRQNNTKQLLVAGGPFPVLLPQKYLQYCDIVVAGEGEKTFCNILNAYNADNKSIFALKGVLYKDGDNIVRNEPGELIENLDELPFPDYEVLQPSLGYYSRYSRVVRKTMAPVMTSRGCPYQCTYCNKSIFGAKFRTRSPGNIIKEIEWLHSKLNVDQIDVLDDNFNLITDNAEEVLDRIIAMDLGIAINCQNGLRADKITDDFAKKLKKSGVFKVGLGIETADPHLMKTIKKNLDLEKVKTAITALRRQGIVVHGYFILGLPGDTPSTMRTTINFAKKANPHFCNFSICIPFPGTEVYEAVKRSGRCLVDIEGGILSGFSNGRAFFEIGPTKAKDVAFYYKRAYKEFYLNIRKLSDILFNIKSPREFIWIANVARSVLFNILFDKAKKTTNQ